MLGIKNIYWSSSAYNGYDIHVLRHNIPKNVCWASKLSGLKIIESIVNPNYVPGSEIFDEKYPEKDVTHNLSDLIYFNINSIVPPFASTTNFLGISFEVSFIDDGTDPDYYTRDNVKVHKVTGDILATKYLLPQIGKLKNFILTVRIILTTTTSLTKAMRVHVHEGISKVWLTPDTLTLPVGEEFSSGSFFTSPKAFSVYAEFDEGEGENTIADITYHPEVNWMLTPGSGSVTIYEDSGRMTVSPTDIGLSGLKKATVELATTINNHLATLPEGSTLPILEGNLVFSGTPNISPGTIEVTHSFSDPPSLQPNIVKFMGRGPGKKKRNEVRNLLIIGEGYLDTEKDNFNEHTNHMITNLTNRGKSRPWDILAGTFNTWRAFKPSRQTGISILNEVIIVKDRRPNESTSTPRAMAIEEFIDYADEYLLGGGKYRYVSGDIPLDVSGATKGQARSTAVNENAGEFGLRKLIQKVGYAVPKDTEFSGTYYSDKRTQWTTFFGSGITLSTVADDTIDFWRNLGERTLMNERDTYWSLTCGSKPRYEDVEPARSIGLNPRGMSSFDLRDYINTLKPSMFSSVIGNELWGITKVVTTEPGSTASTTTFVDGKDQNLVVVLCNGTRYGGAHGELTALSYNQEQTVDFEVVPGSRVLNILPFRTWDVIPGSPETYYSFPEETGMILAHELGHALGLADEYGYEQSPLTDNEKSEIQKSPNTALKSEIFGENNDSFSDISLSWRNCIRIKKIGVLDSIPTNTMPPTGHAYSLEFKKLPDPKFEEGDKVYLHNHEELSYQFFVDQLDEFDGYSKMFTISDVSSDGLQVTITSMDNLITPDDFPENSYLIKPAEAIIKGLGTISIDSGGDVSGVDTAFLIQCAVGDKIVVNNHTYEIDLINSNVLMSISGYTGLISGSEYTILPKQFIYLEVISPTAYNVLNAKKVPFTGPDCVPDLTDPAGTKLQYIQTDSFIFGDPPNQRRYGTLLVNSKFDSLTSTVGAYEGAAVKSCGVLRPTSRSIMRGSLDYYSYNSCPVYAYVIVQQIDKNKHPKLDEFIDTEYPKI